MSVVTHEAPARMAAPIMLGLRRTSRMSALKRRMMALRAPVIVKLLGAHVLAAGALVVLLRAAWLQGWPAATIVIATVATVAIYLALVFIALHPLRDIEAVASRVWRGDFGARVGDSPVADRDMKRIGTMFNLLLDGLTADRARMRALASAVIEAGDRERAAVARELHDSTAQQLAALKLQLSAARRDCADPELASRLEQMQELTGETLEEVRLLAHTVHPRVLDDLGLPAALHKLARESSAVGGIEFDVVADGAEGLPPTVAAVLYRVAQAAVHNVIRHAAAHRATIRLAAHGNEATLEIADDGRGFDVREAERRRPGMGLFTMRERVTLVGGRFEVRSKPGEGARVIAVVPLAEESINSGSTR